MPTCCSCTTEACDPVEQAKLVEAYKKQQRRYARWSWVRWLLWKRKAFKNQLGGHNYLLDATVVGCTLLVEKHLQDCNCSYCVNRHSFGTNFLLGKKPDTGWAHRIGIHFPEHCGWTVLHWPGRKGSTIYTRWTRPRWPWSQRGW